jgi:hypothetical protein
MKTKKKIQILLKFHFETIEPSIGCKSTTKFQKLRNNKSRE